MDEVYCALCGVPFGVYAALYRSGSVEDKHVAWTQYFIALRQKQAWHEFDHDKWYLSGIGRNDSSMGWEGHMSPSTFDARKEEFEDITEWGYNHTNAYKDSGDGDKIVYPMHASCWEIFLQEHALLAMRKPLEPYLDKLGEIFLSQKLEEDGRGLKPDWAGDFEGPEQFWDDAWAWHEEPEASNVVGMLEVAPEYDFLVHDPCKPYGFDELLANPPRLSTGKPIVAMKSGSGGRDPFLALPEELLLQIICLLPVASVLAVRLASGRMAFVRLGSTFWRTRFEYPNELCHINLSSHLSGTAPNDSLPIDWQELCNRLLHPAGEEFKWWQNRKRISSLNRKLIQKMLA